MSRSDVGTIRWGDLKVTVAGGAGIQPFIRQISTITSARPGLIAVDWSDFKNIADGRKTAVIAYGLSVDPVQAVDQAGRVLWDATRIEPLAMAAHVEMPFTGMLTDLDGALGRIMLLSDGCDHLIVSANYGEVPGFEVTLTVFV